MATDTRRGLHIGVLVGVSTAAYAAVLAAVTTLQSAADGALIAARDPIARTVASVASDHDAIERRLGVATERYSGIAGGYAHLGPAIDDLELALDQLAATTRRVGASAARLPARVALPAVGSAPSRATAPRTHAVTRASGA
ncbi:MAG TPA: hypothetical protein VFN41_12335 [Candidatus Limnocylindrales bacterium]|nr:hypothetical protein [Candidatus Limnocylindrales bacterium]